jgi:predicted dehydrogenase
MSSIRFGVIGAGQISYSACRTLSKLDEVEMAAAADPSAERLAALVEEFGFARSYASGEELIADPAIDAIYVAVPNKFHAPLAQAALEAGKHVVLDKPFALSLVEAEGVAAAAAASGKLFFLGMNQRFAENAQRVKNVVSSGALGEIYHAKCWWQRRSGIPKLGTWFGNKAVAGGGALLDIGVHMLDLCLWLCDDFKPVTVTGATYTKFGNRGLGEGGWGMSDASEQTFDVDDFATALIRFESGLSVALDVTWAAHMPEPNRNGVQLFGTEGGATTHPAQVTCYGQLPGTYAVSDIGRSELPYPHQDRMINFVKSILGEEEPCVTIDQALAIQKILDGIYESAKTGREVVLSA